MVRNGVMNEVIHPFKDGLIKIREGIDPHNSTIEYCLCVTRVTFKWIDCVADSCKPLICGSNPLILHTQVSIGDFAGMKDTLIGIKEAPTFGIAIGSIPTSHD